MKPRPTEYEGQLFRSKTEAVFARSLDLASVAWDYEPSGLKIDDGYVPDFLAPENILGALVAMVIEIKPSTVTPQYRREWEDRAEEMVGRCGIIPMSFLLIEGWHYGGVVPFVTTLIDGETDSFLIGDRPEGFVSWVHSHASEASSYRFDLQDPVLTS